MNAILDLLHRHRVVTLSVAGAVGLIALAIVGWQCAGAFSDPTPLPRVSQAYFYDLNTRELFVAPADSEDPLVTNSGDFEGHPAGVRAVVFSCGSCSDESQRFVGWLEMPDPEFDEESLESESSGEDEPSGMLVRRPAGDQWHSQDSPEAETIMREAQSSCGADDAIRPCLPPSAIAD